MTSNLQWKVKAKPIRLEVIMTSEKEFLIHRSQLQDNSYVSTADKLGISISAVKGGSQHNGLAESRPAASEDMSESHNQMVIGDEQYNAETTSNHNLLPSLNRANMPSTEVLGQPDTTIDRPLEKRCYTVEDLQEILSCSREKVYALLAAHKFRWFRLGGQRGPYRISRRSFDEWLDHCME